MGKTAVAADVAVSRDASRLSARVAIAVLTLVCAVALFDHLGAPALFEPDEGRNAEKAREILLLRDWVTPHENFLVVLDKPIPYYWLVAASYRLFGVSEWSARLPSAVAAAGCVVLIFLLAQRRFGLWPGLWAALVLMTSLEFFLLSRIVIFDMALTFFITLALCGFFAALDEPACGRRRATLLVMYTSLAAATLIKGPIGVVLPGLVIVPYLIITQRLSALREIDLGLGIALFVAIVAPWHYFVEARNPGYLHYFFWEENITRYLTPHFNRPGSWYYFLLVVAAGFFPWTLHIPTVFRQAWQRRHDNAVLFLSLWTILPLIFFSFSSAKLPHYILPLFPPLALLTGLTIEKAISAREPGRGRLLALSSLVLCLFMIGCTLALGAWQWLPSAARVTMEKLPATLALWSGAAGLIFGGLAFSSWTGRWQAQQRLFLGFAFGFVIYLSVATDLLTVVSTGRSSRDLVQRAASVIDPSSQLVVYDTSLESLPFYLKATRPLWIVWSGAKRSVMGSFYLAEKGAAPALGYKGSLLTFAEFDKAWDDYPKGRLAVLLKKKNLSRFEHNLPGTAKIVLEHDGFVVVTN